MGGILAVVRAKSDVPSIAVHSTRSTGVIAVSLKLVSIIEILSKHKEVIVDAGQRKVHKPGESRSDGTFIGTFT